MSLRDQIDSDLSTFVDTDEFAVTVTHSGGTFSAICDNEYVEIIDVAGTRPVLTCLTGDVSAIAQGDAVTVNGVSYRVVSLEADGTGLSRMELEVV